MDENKEKLEWLEDQVYELAKFIEMNIEAEPSAPEGAIECAMRLLKQGYKVWNPNNGGCRKCYSYIKNLGKFNDRCSNSQIPVAKRRFDPIFGALGGNCHELNVDGKCTLFSPKAEKQKNTESKITIDQVDIEEAQK